jgi:hypothetical protein
MRQTLPHTWYIRAENKEQAKIIYPFNNKNGKCSWNHNFAPHYPQYAKYVGMKYQQSTRSPNMDEVLTFEEFERLVLNKTSLVNYEIY